MYISTCVLDKADIHVGIGAYRDSLRQSERETDWNISYSHNDWSVVNESQR